MQPLPVLQDQKAFQQDIFNPDILVPTIRRNHYPVLQLQPTMRPSAKTPCFVSFSKSLQIKQTFRLVILKYLESGDREMSRWKFKPPKQAKPRHSPFPSHNCGINTCKREEDSSTPTTLAGNPSAQLCSLWQLLLTAIPQISHCSPD